MPVSFDIEDDIVFGFEIEEDGFVPLIKEITKVPPITFYAEGNPLTDWHLRGAAGGVGKCGLNKMKQEPITIHNGQPAGSQYEGTISYNYMPYGPSIPNGDAFVAKEQQWLHNSYSKTIRIGSNLMGVDDRVISYSNCQYCFSLAAGSYKLIMEAFDHSGQWLSDQLSEYPSSSSWRSTPVIALLTTDSEIIIEEEFDRSLYQGDTYIHIEYPFTIEESMEVGLFFKGIGHNIASEEFTPRFMVVDSDTVAQPFSVTYGNQLFEGVSCWEPYHLTLPILISSGTQSAEVVIDLDSPLGQTDVISMTSSGETIPTYNGLNTISIDSEVTPSEMYIKIFD